MNGNNLEELKKRLYKKGEDFEERKDRVKISGERITPPPPYWQSPGNGKMGFPKKKKNIFVILVIIFVVALIVVALYFLLSGSNIISPKNINIEIKGPIYAEGGKVANFNVFIENKNKVALELADLIFEFPEGSFSSDGGVLTRSRYSLGKINSGEIINKSIDIAFFGLENEEKKINITLEYRLADSNAIFAKDQSYTLKISTPPIGLSMSLPPEANSRQELDIKVEAVSNAETLAKNLSLQMAYPAGFQFIGAEPRPSLGNNTWSLGDLAPLQKKEIIIRGLIEGQDLENKAFNANVGVFDENRVIKSYGVASQTIVIKKSPINLSLFIKGYDLEKNIARPGDSINAELQWLNNLSINIRDTNIELNITGDALSDQSSKKIIWNSSNFSALASIPPGGTGKVQFNFSIKDPLPVETAVNKNFSLILEAKISSLGTSEQGENLEIANDVKKEIKIASPLQLTALPLYYSGPFKNSGPLPPKVDQETTYTISWSLGGNANDFSKVKIIASLPSYVRWLNVISPADSGIEFNERDNIITWEAGDVPAGAGIISPAKEVSFQIGFTPGSNQIGSSPILLGESTLEGYDNFTGEVVNTKVSSVNIILNYDEQFKYGQGKVVK
ncbi:MAG: hypothetical protein NTX55_01405 [Candidatus Parcubacteria bacterium]|nr:hypothetical protein [Candidatus Parcubacteria bacterium]